MKIKVDGIQYDGYDQIQVTNRLDSVCDTFSFTATARADDPFPFRAGQECKITVDDELVLTGHIEVLNASGDNETRVLEVAGRDSTGDLIDSTIGALAPSRGPAATLKSLCERVIASIDSDLEVVDLAEPDPFDEAQDIKDPEPGESAFAFLEKFARKRQVLLTSDTLGRLVIARSEGTNSDAFIQHQIGDPGLANNVLRYTSSHDTTGRFNVYAIASQLNIVAAAAAAASVDAESVADQGSSKRAVDNAVRPGRMLTLPPESFGSAESALLRAEWEKNIRAARGSVYSPIVWGYRDQLGELWRVNRVVKVRDDHAGVSGRMLVNSVTFSKSGDGSLTSLGLIRRDAYSLALQEPRDEEMGLGLLG